MKNLGIETKDTCVSDFAEKLEHFIFFRPGIYICAFLAIILLIYAKLCKLDKFIKNSNQIRQSLWNETLQINTNMYFSESVSKRPKLWRIDLFFGVFVCRSISSLSKLHCVEIALSRIDWHPFCTLSLSGQFQHDPCSFKIALSNNF